MPPKHPPKLNSRESPGGREAFREAPAGLGEGGAGGTPRIRTRFESGSCLPNSVPGLPLGLKLGKRGGLYCKLLLSNLQRLLPGMRSRTTSHGQVEPLQHRRIQLRKRDARQAGRTQRALPVRNQRGKGRATEVGDKLRVLILEAQIDLVCPHEEQGVLLGQVMREIRVGHHLVHEVVPDREFVSVGARDHQRLRLNEKESAHFEIAS